MVTEKLEDIANVTAGTSPKGELINSDGVGLPFFQGSKEFGELVPLPERYTEHPVRTASEGDVLVGVRAPVGRVNLSPFDCAIGRGVMAVTPKKQSDGKFLFYFLRYLEGKWDSLGSTGSVFENLSASVLRSVAIPESLQRAKIGEVLYNLDLKIENNKLLARTLESTAQTIFRSWFIDFDPVKAKMAGETPVGMDAETAALFPDSMEDSELGTVPRGWRMRLLTELASIRYGAAFSSKKFNSDGLGMPLIRIRDLRTQNPSMYTDEEIPRGFAARAGSLLVGMDGEFEPVIWFGEESWVNQRVCMVQPNHGCDVSFLQFHLQPILKKIEHGTVGTTVLHLGKKELDSISILYPSSELVSAYSQISSSILGLRISLAKESTYLRSLRDSLLPRLVSGELEIRDEMLAA